MPEGVKVATAVAEVIRRWKTTSTLCDRETFKKITCDYMDLLAGNGYTTQWREKILRKALMGYRRILLEVRRGKTRRNRRGADTMGTRRFKKLAGKQAWYQPFKDESEPELGYFQRDGESRKTKNSDGKLSTVNLRLGLLSRRRPSPTGERSSMWSLWGQQCQTYW